MESHKEDCKLYLQMYESNYGPCSFCGSDGHWADNCVTKQKAYQEQKRSGHLCSYCGSQEHVYTGCRKYRINLERQKEDLKARNVQLYMAAGMTQIADSQESQNVQQPAAGPQPMQTASRTDKGKAPGLLVVEEGLHLVQGVEEMSHLVDLLK